MATYTTQNPDKVERLVLYAPVWIRQTPSLAQAGAGPLGAYRTVTREQAMQRWMTGVPEDKKATLIPAGWFDAWADATWATDPVGAKMNPPVHPRAERRAGRTATIIGPPARPTTIRPRSPCRRCWCRPNGTATCRPTWRRRCSRCSSTRPASATCMLRRGHAHDHDGERTAACCLRQSRPSSTRRAGRSRSASACEQRAALRMNTLGPDGLNGKEPRLGSADDSGGS